MSGFYHGDRAPDEPQRYDEAVRILMTARHFPPDVYSGTETVFSSLYARARTRHEVRLVVGWQQSRRHVPAEAVGVSMKGRSRASEWVALAVAVRNEAKRWRPDVVLSNCIEVPPTGRPTVCIVHDLNFGLNRGRPASGIGHIDGESWGALAKRAFYGVRARGLERMIAVSHATAEALEAAGVDKERIQVIHNGVDLSQFRPSPPVESEMVRFVYPSRILPGKAQHLAIDAIARLPRLHKRRAELHIVGAATDRNYLDQLRVQAYEQPVRFTTDVPDMAPHLAEADVVLFPSVMAEGFGFTAVEAMACAKPVIWADQQAIREATGGIGISVPIENVEALRSEMIRLMDDPEERQRIGEQGRAHVEAHHDWDVVWERYEACLAEVLR